MTERLAAEQRVPVRAAPPPPGPATPGGGVGTGDGRSAEFVRSVSMPGGGNRRPVLELVERHGTGGEEAPPARPARASGRHGRHGRRAVQQQRSADQLPQKRAPPPRPPPPNLQAALGSPPSYEETLKMDSAAKNRLSAPISSSGNPFLIGVRRSSSPSPAIPTAAPTTPLHRDLSSPALTPGGGAGNLTGAPVSRTSSTRSSAAESASRRSSATPSLDSLSARSGPAVDGPATGTEGPATDSASSDGGGAVLGRSDSNSSRSSYNPFLPLPSGGGGGSEGGTTSGGPSPSVNAPPRRPGPPVHGSQPSDVRLGQTPPSAAWVGSALSAVSRDADWAGRVSRAQAEQRGSPFSRDGPGRTAHHGSTVHHGAPFGRETAWAGRVNRDAASSHGHGMVTSASSGSLSKDGEAASGVALSTSSGFLSQPAEPSSSSATGVATATQSTGAPMGASASPSVSVSTSPTNSLPASPPPSPPASPPPSPPTSPPPDPPTSPPVSPPVNLPDPPSSPPIRHPNSPGVSFPTSHPLASSAHSATTSPPTSPSNHSPSHLVLTVHTTVSHDSDDSTSRPGGAESVHCPSTSTDRQSFHSPSASVDHQSSVGSARSSTTSLDRTGHSVTSLDRTGRSTASLERSDRSSRGAALHNGSATSIEHGVHGTAERRSLPAEAVMRRDRGTSAPREEAEQGTHRRSSDAPPLNWGLPVEPVTADTPQAVALYDFHSSAPGDLTFKAGDLLVLLRRVTADWLLCRLGSRHGLVPAHHVRETVPLPGVIPSAALPGSAALPAAVPAPSPSSVQPASPVGQPASPGGSVSSPDGQPGAPSGREGQRVMALYDFVPQEKYDLGFKAGDMLVVVGKLNDDWGYGSRRGLTGQFPLAYVDVAVETVPTI